MSAAEEAVYRKLLADGDGTSEDKRFQMLFSLIASLGKAEGQAAAGDANTVRSRMLSILDQVELCLLKHCQCAGVHEAEARQNERLFNEISSLVESNTRRIESVKEELAAAKLVRRNRQEYSVLAKVIKERPSREETTRRLKELQDQLDADLERQRVLEQKLAERRKNLYSFAILLNNLDEQLAADDSAFDSGAGTEAGAESKRAASTGADGDANDVVMADSTDAEAGQGKGLKQ